MPDYQATLYLKDAKRLEEATDLLAGALASNEAVIDPLVSVGSLEDQPEFEWLSVSFNWNPESSAKIDNDFVLDDLTDAASVSGMVKTLERAGIEVEETFDEQA